MGCKPNSIKKEYDQYENFLVHSEILKEDRQILISKPNFKHSTKLGEKKYPVIYVLDGEDMFHLVSAIVNFLSGIKGNKIIPESLVVGIVNTNRTKNYTHDLIEFESESGHGSEFSKFIENELFKLIQDRYSVANYRTIIGHSYGGLFVINTLNKNHEMFDNYIALDPSYQYIM